MEDPPMPVNTPQKRLHDDDGDVPASGASTPLTVLSKTPSPYKTLDTSQTPAPPSNPSSTMGASSNQQSTKRRKLTTQEKEQQRLEKEGKDKARAEKKAQKEAEEKLKAEQKAQKDDEKRRKDEEKRKKNEEREEKKRAKEFEQQQKVEEKQKKERSQMRLNAFFSKPKPGEEAPAKAVVPTHQNPPAQATLLAPADPLADTNSAPPSPQKSLLKDAHNDYERYFLPFSLPSTALLAPYNAFMQDAGKRTAARARLDKIIAQEDVETEPVTARSLKARLSDCGPRGRETIPVVELVERINGSSDSPIDLTNENSLKLQKPLDLLKEIPMKYIHFPEDVRPPYFGTYTKRYSRRDATRLARNPLLRLRRDTDYDYDSEAEWEEPEEGEDLDSEGDEDLDEDAEDDMDGFIEDDQQVKRRLITGDLEPISTGLCWEDSERVSRLNDGSGAISTEFKEYRMGFLLEPHPQAIDPFSTAYWTPEPAPATTASKTVTINGLMNPPRVPLTSRPLNGLLNTLKASPQDASSTVSKPAKPPKRLIPDDQLAAFKAEIQGSDLTKIGLIEALKKKFPKVPKDAITNTLSIVAKRVGPSASEKRWILLS